MLSAQAVSPSCTGRKMGHVFCEGPLVLTAFLRPEAWKCKTGIKASRDSPTEISPQEIQVLLSVCDGSELLE